MDRQRPPSRLLMSSHLGGGGASVTADGHLDLMTSPELRGALAHALHAECAAVRVDLREVRSVDGAGLQVLREAEALARELCKRFTVLVRRGPVAAFIEGSGATRHLAVVVAEPPPGGPTAGGGGRGLPHRPVPYGWIRYRFGARPSLM